MRDELPQRRPHEILTVDHVWLRGTHREMTETMTLSVGLYGAEDPRIGEVFITCDNHVNERSIALWHDIGVLISYCLQFGATVEQLCGAMARGEVIYMDRVEISPHSPAGTVLEALLALQVEIGQRKIPVTQSPEHAADAP